MASKFTTLEKLKEIIVESSGVNPDLVVSSARFVDDLECDELEQIELMIAVEEEFGIEIDEIVADKIETVGDLVKCIEEALDE